MLDTPGRMPARFPECVPAVMAAVISGPIDQVPGPGASVLTHRIYLVRITCCSLRPCTPCKETACSLS